MSPALSLALAGLVQGAGVTAAHPPLDGPADVSRDFTAQTDLVELVAMLSLAALLMVVGLATVRPTEMASVARTGRVQSVVLTVTFVLTILVDALRLRTPVG